MGFLKRGGDVSAGVEEPPNVDQAVALHVEHQVRVSGNRLRSKARGAGFVREARCSELWVLAGALSASFDGVDESAGDGLAILAGFAEVVVDRRLEVRGCEYTLLAIFAIAACSRDIRSEFGKYASGRPSYIARPEAVADCPKRRSGLSG